MPSSADHTAAVMTAVIAFYKADATTSAICGDRVFDYVPDNDPMPYIRYGVAITGPYQATGVIGSDITVTIHGFVKGYDSATAQALQKALHRLEDQDLALTSGYLLELNFLSSQIIDGEEGEQGYYHIISQFQCITGEAP